jgi:DedD protein
MPLPSFLQRLRQGAADTKSVADAVPLSQADIEATRTRARRRLVGMVVLVGAGVVGFPWLFETQPRPLSADVQIVQAGEGRTTPNGHPRPMASGKVAVAGIVAPQASEADDEAPATGLVAPEPKAAEPVKDAPKAAAKAESHEPREPREEILSDKPPVKKAAEPAEARVAERKTEPHVEKKPEPAKSHDKPSDKPMEKVAEKSADKDKAVKLAEKDKAEKAEKAKAAASKPVEKVAEKAADKDASRYIVQIGAFGDATKAQDVRQKVERLGIKTYTQAVDTPDGKRIRVRVGPYADKAEADKAMATLRKAGLGGNLLTL